MAERSMPPLKQAIKRYFPALVSLVHFARRLPYRHGSMEDRFRRMVRSYVRGGLESLSGPGSTLNETQEVRRQLPFILRELNARSMLDIPCGDFHWMQKVDLGLESYVGAEILDELVRANQAQHESESRKFVKLDLTRDKLPRVDLVLCRDCLVHLSFADAFRALANIKRSGSRYLLTTTFPSVQDNLDCYSGEWRRLNLQRPPLNFPAPVRLINEQCTVELYADKSLGLWLVNDIPSGTRGFASGGAAFVV